MSVSAKDQFEARDDTEHVGEIEVAEVRHAEDLSLHTALAIRNNGAKFFFKSFYDDLRIHAGGSFHGGHRAPGPLGENLKPQILTSLPSAAREKLRIFDQVGHPNFFDVLQRFAQRKNE